MHYLRECTCLLENGISWQYSLCCVVQTIYPNQGSVGKYMIIMHLNSGAALKNSGSVIKIELRTLYITYFETKMTSCLFCGDALGFGTRSTIPSIS